MDKLSKEELDELHSRTACDWGPDFHIGDVHKEKCGFPAVEKVDLYGIKADGQPLKLKLCFAHKREVDRVSHAFTDHDSHETNLTGPDLIKQWNDCLKDEVFKAVRRGDFDWAKFLSEQTK